MSDKPWRHPDLGDPEAAFMMRHAIKQQECRHPRPDDFQDGDRVYVSSWAKREGVIRGWREDMGQWWVDLGLPNWHAFDGKYLRTLFESASTVRARTLDNAIAEVETLRNHDGWSADARYAMGCVIDRLRVMRNIGRDSGAIPDQEED